MYSQRIEVKRSKREKRGDTKGRAGTAPRYRSLEGAVRDWKPLGCHARSDWSSPISISNYSVRVFLADVNKTCRPSVLLTRFTRPEATTLKLFLRSRRKGFYLFLGVSERRLESGRRELPDVLPHLSLSTLVYCRD